MSELFLKCLISTLTNKRIFRQIIDFTEMLSIRDHPNLTEDIIKVLNHNKIRSVVDFLSEDSEKISLMTNLRYSEILDVRAVLLKKYSAPAINAKTLYFNSNKKSQYFNTFIPSLDTLTGGGIPVGYITEICGLAACGKTQLCFQITINCIRKLGIDVLYIDTKGDFSAMKIQKLLSEYECNYEEMATIMHKIKVKRIFYIDDLVALMERIQSNKIDMTNVKLVILDSLPSLMFQYLGDQSKIGLTLLNKFVNHVKSLCQRLEITFICTNILTRWVHHDFIETEDHDEPIITETNLTERRYRCLGRYWQHIPALVLIVTKLESQNNTGHFTNISVKVAKSIMTKCDVSCNLTLSNKKGIMQDLVQ